LEKALHAVDVHDFSTIIRGEIEDSRLPAAINQRGIKILKLHGSLKGFSNFVFTRDDLVEYPKPVHDIVDKLTSGDILVCGYAYNDQCVIASFSKTGPGNVVIVNPNPPRMLQDVARNRKGQYVFSDLDGHFDVFFTKLSAALNPRPPESPSPVAPNPFKFLEAYRPEDREWFFGREDTVQTVSRRLIEQPGPAFFIAGPSKVGKTSFVRAGLMPVLNPEPLYLRCQANLEEWLPAELARRDRFVPASGLDVAFQSLAQSTGSRFYLVVDQFERVIRPFEQKPRGRQQFPDFLKSLMKLTPDSMTIIYVVRSEGDLFYSTLMKLKASDYCITMESDTAIIDEVIRRLADKAGISFEPGIIQQLQDLCDKSETKEPFTLAHVNAICHLLCDSGNLDLPALNNNLAKYRDTLNSIINLDVIGFVEDIPFDEAARALFTRMLKVVSKQRFQSFAECMCNHFGELFPNVGLRKGVS
jgi:hypothetical protein